MSSDTVDLGLWRILRNIRADFLIDVTGFYLYGTIGGSVLLFTNNGLYGYGFNGNGRLGVGHFRLDVYNNPERIESLQGVTVHHVTGGDFIMLLATSGDLWTWGANNYGQLGLFDHEDRAEPIRIMNNVIQVQCSATHVIALDRQHRCWCWGQNKYGQISWTLPISDRHPVATLIDFDGKKIKHITCCESASLALTLENSLHIWGKLDRQQLINTVIYLDSQTNFTKLIGLAKAFVLLTADHQVCLFQEVSHRNSMESAIVCQWLEMPSAIHDVIGSLTFDTFKFILVCRPNYCLVWDMIKKELITTGLQSVPDVSSLYACYYTNIRADIPRGLISSLESLGSFNNEFSADLCIKVYTYSHFIRKIFVDSTVLCQHSDYLQWLIEHHSENDIHQSDRTVRQILIRRYSYAVVYWYFRYVHTKRLLMDLHSVAELYDMAQEFQDIDLIRLIPEFLYDQTGLNAISI